MKKASKVLAILLAFSMMFTTVAFAKYVDDDADTNSYMRYAGTGYAETNSGTAKKPWDYSYLNTQEFASFINGKVESGDSDGSYTSVTVYVEGGAMAIYDQLYLKGIHGTANSPVVLKFNYNGFGNGTDVEKQGEKATIKTDEAAPAVVLKDCSYVEVWNANISAEKGAGVYVTGCDNVAVKNVSINGIQYTDYKIEEPEEPEVPDAGVDAEISDWTEVTGGEAVATRATEETENPWAAAVYFGEAVLVDNGSKNVIIEDVKATNCKTAFVVTNTTDAETDIRDIQFINCEAHSINYEAYIMDGAEHVTVSGGVVSNVGTIAYAPENAYQIDSAVDVCRSKGVVVEDIEICDNPCAAISLYAVTDSIVQRVFSHNNYSFMDNQFFGDSNVRIRYNISGHDNAEQSNIITGDVQNVWVYNNTFSDANVLYFADAKNCTIKNNLFSMMIMREVKLASGNNISNNVYHNTIRSIYDYSLSSMTRHPNFAYDAKIILTDYTLNTNSKLIGAGVQVEEDMGTADIFGNDITEVTEHNIGAYEGAGIEAVDKIDVNGDNFQSMIQALDYWFGDAVRAIINFLVPQPVQDAISKVVSSVVSWIIDKVTDLI